MAFPAPKESDTTDYTGVLSPEPTDAGTLQTGGWANDIMPPPSWNFPNEVLEGLPSNVRVQLSGVAQTGPNQYAATLSLSGENTLQLTPNAADAQQNPTDAVSPNVFGWRFSTRNEFVATVDANGLITAVGRGECEISIRSSRQVNASFTGATPSGTEGVNANLQVRVLP